MLIIGIPNPNTRMRNRGLINSISYRLPCIYTIWKSGAAGAAARWWFVWKSWPSKNTPELTLSRFP